VECPIVRLPGCAGEVSAGAVVATHSVSVDVDYDNGIVALHGPPRNRWRDDRAANRIVREVSEKGEGRARFLRGPGLLPTSPKHSSIGGCASPSGCYTSPHARTLRRRDKGKPAARRERKATGLPYENDLAPGVDPYQVHNALGAADTTYAPPDDATLAYYENRLDDLYGCGSDTTDPGTSMTCRQAENAPLLPAGAITNAAN
jgi:hypothetical protein